MQLRDDLPRLARVFTQPVRDQMADRVVGQAQVRLEHLRLYRQQHHVFRRGHRRIELVAHLSGRPQQRFLLHLKILVEPSGAVAAAAVLHRKLPPGISSVAVILSGGNVDPEALGDILRAG